MTIALQKLVADGSLLHPHRVHKETLCYLLLSLTFHQARANYRVCKWPHYILLWKSCVYYHKGSECFYGYLVTKPDALLQQKYSGAIACIQIEALKNLRQSLVYEIQFIKFICWITVLQKETLFET